MDLEQSLVHELGTLPWSLELFDGALVKTNKAALPKLLEDGVESLKCLPAQTAAVIRRYSGASNAEQDNREILTTGRNDLQENTDARGSKNSWLCRTPEPKHLYQEQEGTEEATLVI